MANGIQPKKNSDTFFTVEFFGVTLIITSFLLFVCLLFGGDVIFVIGSEVQAFLLGVLGYLSYPVLVCLNYVGFMMLFGKKIVKSNVKSKLVVTILFVFLVIALLSVITNLQKPASFNDYVDYAYNSGKNGVSGVVAGGALFAIITYPLVNAISYFWSIVAISVVILISISIAIKSAKNKPKTTVEDKTYPAEVVANNVSAPVQQPVVEPVQQLVYPNAFNGYPQPNGYPQQNPYFNAQPYQNGYPNPQQFGAQQVYPNGFQSNGYVNPYDGNRFEANTYQPTNKEILQREESLRVLYGNNNKTYSEEFNNSFNEDKYRVDNTLNVKNSISEFNKPVQPVISEPISTFSNEPTYNYEETDTSNDYFGGYDEEYESSYDDEFDNDTSNDNAFEVDSDAYDSFDNDDSNYNDDYEESIDEPIDEVVEKPIEEPKRYSTSIMPDLVQESAYRPELENVTTGNIIENMPINYKYKAPPISLFKTIDNSQNNYDNEIFKNDIKGRILTTLSTFGVDTTIANIYRGPAVTRFDLVVPPAMTVTKITKLADDLNLRIAARSSIRMLAPVPNTSYVGIEVPNKQADSVSIKDIISSDNFLNTPPFSLYFAFGKDIIGNPIALDLADMPHVLISGTTGSGKSVCLNSMILSLVSKYGPDQLRFVIIDPKQVDFEPFRELPHMLFDTIVDNDLPLCNSVLQWAVDEMERRYSELKLSKSKNISDYNRKAVQNKQRIMPRIVIIIDEFADLMLRDKKGIGEKINLLAAKSRASGIHLVLAAQRPSADIVNGPIKANLPARLVFRASSHVDSSVSLGETGAEKLLGKGDCLYKTGGMLNTERAMGAYVSDDELYDVVEYVAKNNVAYYDRNSWTKIKSRVQADTNEAPSSNGFSSGANKDGDIVDHVYVDALRVGFEYDGISVSSLQRRLGLGYPRAAKVVDWLLDNGYISAEAIKGKRKILISYEEFEKKFLNGDSSNNSENVDFND